MLRHFGVLHPPTMRYEFLLLITWLSAPMIASSNSTADKINFIKSPAKISFMVANQFVVPISSWVIFAAMNAEYIKTMMRVKVPQCE